MPHPLIGKPAPKDLELKNQDGESVQLDSFVGKGRPSIIFFYPKDDSYGCTKEVCSFRDSYHVFKETAAVIVGISGDTVEAHKQFSNKQNLPFPLLSDVNGEARKAFEVSKTMGLLPGRCTYLIDKDGIVNDVYNSQLDFEGHVKSAVEFIKVQSAVGGPSGEL